MFLSRQRVFGVAGRDGVPSYVAAGRRAGERLPNKPAAGIVKEVERTDSEVSSRSALSPDTEFELIAQAQQGDRRAFGELVHLHHSGVINVVYRMCGDANLAEDAAQEAFIRAWQHLSKYRPQSPFRNWVYRIATNAALDALRRERETEDVDDLPLAAQEDGPEVAAEKAERGERVQQAVLALPPASRAVLVLREYEGLAYQEIAETLGIPIGTVMSRLNYARGQLRKSLAPYLEVA
jgi:RNA polymerase sigma-70 factor (ECF subfamily)